MTTARPDILSPPDTARLARRLSLCPLPPVEDGTKRPQSVPLFLDGLHAFTDYDQWLPLPASRLDRSSPWTAWGGVIT